MHNKSSINNVIGEPQSQTNRTMNIPVPGKPGDNAFKVWKETEEGQNNHEITTPEQWVAAGYGFFSVEQKDKLDGLDTQEEIDLRIETSKEEAINEVKSEVYLKTETFTKEEVYPKEETYDKTQVDQKLNTAVSQAQGTPIEITGTVLPQGASVPAYITNVGTADLYGGDGVAVTYTQTGGSSIVVGSGKFRKGYYNRSNNLWTASGEISLPTVDTSDFVKNDSIHYSAGKNKFNVDDYIADKSIFDDNGTIGDTVGSRTSKPIDVVGASYITISNENGVSSWGGSKRYRFLDSSGVYVPNSGGSITHIAGSLPKTLQVPLNAKFFQFTFKRSNETTDVGYAKFQVEFGTFATSFQKYENVIFGINGGSIKNADIEVYRRDEVDLIADSTYNKSKQYSDTVSNVNKIRQEEYNIVNPSVVNDGNVWTLTGTTLTLSPNAQYNAYDNVSVEPNTQYTASGKLGLSLVLRRTFFLDADGVYISERLPNEAHNQFTTPANCRFIKGTFYSTQGHDGLCINKGSTSTYKPYVNSTEVSYRFKEESKAVTDDDIPTLGDVKSLLGSKDYSFLRVVFLGDSSTDRNTSSYAVNFQNVTGCYMANLAVGGATWVSDDPLSNCIEKQINTLITNKSTHNPNLIVIQGGGNDISLIRTSSARLGSFASATDNYNYKTYDPRTTLYNSLRFNLERLKREFPNAVIILGTTWQRWLASPDTYDINKNVAKAITDMATYLSVRVIDGFNHSGISYLTEIKNRNSFDGTPSEANPYYDWVEPNGEVVSSSNKTPDAVKRYGLYCWDGTHVNAVGRVMLSKFMISKIINEVNNSNI